MTNPCKDCLERRQACHAECNKWKLFSIFHATRKKKIDDFRNIHRPVITAGKESRVLAHLRKKNQKKLA